MIAKELDQPGLASVAFLASDERSYITWRRADPIGEHTMYNQ
jgi:hypothetical protein